MKKSIMLPSLLVVNSFFFLLLPKTSNAGNVALVPNKDVDSVSTSFLFDTNILRIDTGAPIFSPEYVKFYKLDSLSIKPLTFNDNEISDEYSYNIVPVGKDVKYTSPDGSGFIRKSGSRTWRNMNPGAIRYGDFTKQYGACGKAGGFAVFPTEEHGMEALKGLLKSDGYCNLTIEAAIYKWAPPSDNNDTKAYQRHLSKMTGLNLSMKLHQLTPAQLEKVANAIKILEGWKVGSEELFDKEPKVITMNKPNLNNFVNYQNTRQYNA